MVDIKDVLSGVGTGLGGGLALGGQAIRQRFAEHETERRRLPLRVKVAGFLGIEPEKAITMRKEIKDLETGGFESYLKGERPEVITTPAEVAFKSGDFDIAEGKYAGNKIKVLPSGQFVITDDTGKRIASGLSIKAIKDENIRQAILEQKAEVRGIPATSEERAELKKQYDKEVIKRKKQLREFLHNELPYYRDLLSMLQLSEKLKDTTKGRGELLMDTKNMKDSIEGIAKTMELLSVRAEQSTMSALGTEREKRNVRSVIASLTGSIADMHNGVSVAMEKKMPANKQQVSGTFTKFSSNAFRPYLEAILDLSEDEDIPVSSLTATRDLKTVIAQIAKKEGKNPQEYIDSLTREIKSTQKIDNEFQRNKAFNKIYTKYARDFASTRTAIAINSTIQELKADGSLTKETLPILRNMDEWTEMENFLTTTYEVYLRRMQKKITGGWIDF